MDWQSLARGLSGPIEGGFQEPDEKGRKLCRSEFNLAWLRELEIDPAVIFDVGSFDGADALRFKQAYPAARVVCIEADPLRAAAIRTNLDGEDITLVEGAVIDRDGKAGLFHAGDRSERGSRCASVFQWGKKPFQELVQVEAVTLASVCRTLGIRQIDLLHMDIEGAELLAINGLGRLRPRLIWAEVHDGWAGAPGSEKTHRGIVALGYRKLCRYNANRLYLHAR